jgi:hypothetical protein
MRGSTISVDFGFEASTAVMFEVEVFWVVTPYRVVVGYNPEDLNLC